MALSKRLPPVGGSGEPVEAEGDFASMGSAEGDLAPAGVTVVDLGATCSVEVAQLQPIQHKAAWLWGHWQGCPRIHESVNFFPCSIHPFRVQIKIKIKYSSTLDEKFRNIHDF